MPTLPQLIEEDIEAFNEALDDLLAQSEASVALILDKGGFLLTRCGKHESFDTTTLAALAAGSFAATQSLAQLVSENDFASVYQQGETTSLLVLNVDEFCLLMVVFPARISAGAVKFFALDTIKRVARQLRKAQKRAPDAGLDLSMLNVAETNSLFKKRVA